MCLFQNGYCEIKRSRDKRLNQNYLICLGKSLGRKNVYLCGPRSRFEFHSAVHTIEWDKKIGRGLQLKSFIGFFFPPQEFCLSSLNQKCKRATVPAQDFPVKTLDVVCFPFTPSCKWRVNTEGKWRGVHTQVRRAPANQPSKQSGHLKHRALLLILPYQGRLFKAATRADCSGCCLCVTCLFTCWERSPAPKQFASTWIHKCATGKSSRAATLRGKVHSLKELLYMFSTSVPTKLPKIKVIFCSNIPQGPCFLTYCQNYFHMCCCTMARFSTRQETNYYD